MISQKDKKTTYVYITVLDIQDRGICMLNIKIQTLNNHNFHFHVFTIIR